MNFRVNTSKGDKVIPTEQIAKPAVAPKIGCFALLWNLLHVQGSGLSKISFSQAMCGSCAVSVRRSGQTFQPGNRLKCCVPALLCALVGAFAFASVAHAEAPRLSPDGTFSTGPWRTDGVAVDNSSGPSHGDVYVGSLLTSTNSAVGHVDKFDVSGKLLSPSPFGEGANSGTAVDPVNGDVYVLGNALAFFGAPVIGTYEPSSGAPVGSPFPVPASNNLEIFGPTTVVQIAADSAGDVYVPVVPQNEVLEYKPSECPALPEPCTLTPLKTFTGGAGAGALKGPTGVAVDSAGNLWVADTGNNRIEELEPGGAPVEVNGKPVEIKSQGVQDVALDGHGDVLAIVTNRADFCGSVAPPCSHLVEYSSAGVQIADVGAGSFEGGRTQGSALTPMVAVNDATGRVYVTDETQALVFVFAPPAAPILGRELAAEVKTSEAKLGALVDPGGIETTYRFEYDTREYREGEGPHGVSVPFPEGSVGEGFASRTVWAAASGLAPGTTYHYRVVAMNELGTVVGPDQTFTTQSAKEARCEVNEEFRGGTSAALPDCRAYELVTPPVKNSSQLQSVRDVDVAVDGDAISFITKEPLPGAPAGGIDYVATRGAGGWGSEEIAPLESYTGITCPYLGIHVSAYSEELSSALVEYGIETSQSQEGNRGEAAECNAEGLQVTPGEPVGYENLLLRDNATGAYRLVNAPPPGVTPANAHFEGASADLSHVVFRELAALTPEAPSAVVGGPENLYEWDEGALRLLTILPGGAPTQGVLVEHGISAEGSHILFTSGGGLYVRVDGSSTVQVDASQVGGAGGGGSFQAMSAEGSTILFTDENRLTPGSTAESKEPDLYECVLPEGASKCELSDLTVAKAGEHADVLHVSRLGSQDSSHVYFTARGVLAEGATSGANNLYVYEPDPEHEGQFKTVLIATLAEGDAGLGAVSPDGAWFAFGSTKSLTGYDNALPGGGPQQEIFLYGAGSDSHPPPMLACASCDPSGEAPTAGGAQLEEQSGAVDDDGRVFFQTEEALVPSDTDGQMDVYEYEDGQPSLISSGTSSKPSEFVGASESGGDVFFTSRQTLVGEETGQETIVVYDAHVDGGFPAVAVPPSCATADACRVPVAPLPSVFGAPASATFSGAGNLAPPPTAVVKKVTKKTVKCKRGFAKNRKGKCVSSRSKRKKAKKADRASHNGRGK